jgi:hypothetical protein
MTDTRRYALVWLAAAFLGVNVGAGALLLVLFVVDSWLHWYGAARTIVLCAAFVLAWFAMTLAVGKALIRRVSKELQ